MNKTKRIENTFDIVRILIAIAVAYLIALIILALISDDPLTVIGLFITGPFNSTKHIGDIFTRMIPLIFTGLCMCFVYAINKFNLAGEGAVNLGGCLAAWVAIALKETGVPGWFCIILCVAVGALAGMLANAIPAVADQVFHADVCVISLMLNYILLYFTTFILKNVIKDQGAAVTASYKLGNKVKLPKLIPGTTIHIGLLIAVVCVVFVAILFYKMPFGYKMRAVGINPTFAKYIGIPVTSTIILAQVIGGAFAGMGGAVQILGMFPRYKWESLTNYGFDGLMIAVLARKNPILVPLSAFLIAYIRNGADLVATKTQIPPEFVSIIQGIIIVLVAAEMFLSGWKKRLIFNAAKKDLKEKEAKA